MNTEFVHEKDFFFFYRLAPLLLHHTAFDCVTVLIYIFLFYYHDPDPRWILLPLKSFSPLQPLLSAPFTSLRPNLT